MPFYLDPPYWGCETDYRHDVFVRADFMRLGDQLAGIKGHFSLSINDAPSVRELFGGFHVVEVATTYMIGAGAHAIELSISNLPMN